MKYLLWIIEIVPANHESLASQEVDLLGEGGTDGELPPGKSLVFAVLEVCLCLLVRQLPSLNPAPNAPVIPNKETSGVLIARAVDSMHELTKLCSPQGKLSS